MNENNVTNGAGEDSPKAGVDSSGKRLQSVVLSEDSPHTFPKPAPATQTESANIPEACSSLPPPPQETGRISREARMAILAAASFFFIIMSYYVLKPIRESLAIELGARQVPALNVLSMFSLVLANGFYSWMVGKYRREVFIPWLIRGSLGCLIGFWLIFRELAGPAIHGAPLSLTRTVAITGYFIWVNIFGLFLPSMFWSFMNDVFSPEQGSRLYSKIGYGGLVGGLAGGGITAILVKSLGTAQMFLVTIVLLEPALWCMREIDRLSSESVEKASTLADNGISGTVVSPANAEGKDTSGTDSTAGSSRESKIPASPQKSGALEGVRLTIASPYLGLMALETFLYTFGSSLFSYQVNELMEHEITARDQRTLYWAHLYNAINGLSLITQWLVTSRVMKTRSPWVGLIMLPMTQIIGSVFLLGSPSLDIAAIFSVVRYALNYSTGRAVRELFFTPLAREEKYQGKGFIDTFVFRMGDGMASSLLLAGIALMGPGRWIDASVISANSLGGVTIFLIGIAFARKARERLRQEPASSQLPSQS